MLFHGLFYSVFFFFFLQVTQSCLTLCNPMDYMVHGILQARILEWVAVSSPGDLTNLGIETTSPAFPALAGGFFITEPLRKPFIMNRALVNEVQK